jgi:hypothetical protein
MHMTTGWIRECEAFTGDFDLIVLPEVHIETKSARRSNPPDNFIGSAVYAVGQD